MNLTPHHLAERLLTFLRTSSPLEAHAANPKDRVDSQQAIQRAFEHIEALYNNPTPYPGVRSGLLDLDDLTGGWPRGQLSVVGGRPAMGKSTLLRQSATYAAHDEQTPTLFVALQDSLWKTMALMVCAEARVSYSTVRRGGQTEEQWAESIKTAGRLADAPLFFLDVHRPRVDALAAHCRHFVEREGVEAVFVDFLGLVRPPRPLESFSAEVAEVTRRLGELASELDIAVVAAVQHNRRVEHRADKRPRLSDLRNSEVIEEVAHLVCQLYRPPRAEADNAQRRRVELHVTKNTYGNTGWVNAQFDAEFTRLEHLQPDG